MNLVKSYEALNKLSEELVLNIVNINRVMKFEPTKVNSTIPKVSSTITIFASIKFFLISLDSAPQIALPIKLQKGITPKSIPYSKELLEKNVAKYIDI